MIDWARIKELQNDLGPEGYDEVIELFLDEMETRLQEIEARQTGCDADDLHFLKGSASNIGFSDLLALCEHFERDGVGRLETVRVCYEASKNEFLTGMSLEVGQIKTPDSTSSSVISR